MDLGLKGKVAMVAGASRGLGYAVARALAAEGVHVSMSSRNAQAIADAGKRVSAETDMKTLAVPVDVRSADSIASWHRQTIETFGGLDLLFANSGGPPAGSGAVVRRRRMEERVRAPRAECGADGPAGRAVHESARRRRDRRVHFLGRQRARSQSGVVEHRADVDGRAVEDTRQRAGGRQDPGESSPAGPHRHRPRPRARHDSRQCDSASQPTMSGKGGRRRFRSAGTASLPNTPTPRCSSFRTPRATSREPRFRSTGA